MHALVLDQSTDCGSETFPCRPSLSLAVRANLRTGPHCIGPKTTFDALNSRKPNFFSRWSMWIVRVTDWNRGFSYLVERMTRMGSSMICADRRDALVRCIALISAKPFWTNRRARVFIGMEARHGTHGGDVEGCR